MHDIYNYIPDKNHDSMVYTVASGLCLQSVLQAMLFLRCNMSCTFTSALPAVCVQCPIWLFICSSLISRFPGMLLGYCVSESEMVPVAPIITGITSAVTFHKR